MYAHLHRISIKSDACSVVAPLSRERGIAVRTVFVEPDSDAIAGLLGLAAEGSLLTTRPGGENVVCVVDVLVAGAAGNTGRPLVEELHRSGVSVRAMVRHLDDVVPGDPEKVVADFDDVDSVRAAMRGVRRAYLVTPSSERAEEQQCNFVGAASEAGVERLVLLSQLGARADSPVRFLRYHAVVEQ